jgi:enoyl-CoA hydratase
MAVRIEIRGRVWTVIHSRPEARNAMDPESAQALHDAFVRFDADADAAAAVLWGEGGAFCAGFDLKAASMLSADELEKTDRGPMGPTRLELDKPVIAAVAGPAVAGGFELALCCDVRVMEASAYFGVYCRRWGVPLIDGGTLRLPRIVGHGRAMDMILTGRAVDAHEALSWGLANRVVRAGGARAAAVALAKEIARFPQACLRADRASAYAGWSRDIDDGLKHEARRGAPVIAKESVAGAARFAGGKGRGGDFSDI